MTNADSGAGRYWGGLKYIFKRFLCWPLYERQLRLKRDREGYTKENFISSLSENAISKDVAEDVWNILANMAVVEGFKPAPEDDLLNVFGLAEEDLDEDIVLMLLLKYKCNVPSDDEMRMFGPIATVGDLVFFISQQKSMSSLMCNK